MSHPYILNRRSVVKGLAAAAGSAMLPNAAFAAMKKFNDEKISITTFGGPWIDRITAELGKPMAEAGITMQFTGGRSQDFLAKLIASRGQAAPFDVVEIADETYDDFLRGDFIEKLNLANLPNLAHLDKSSYDDYTVANWATQPAILYNVDKLKEIGVTPPTTYGELTNPKLAGKVLLGDINSYNGFYQVVGMAYEAGGDESNLEPGWQMLEKIKPHSYSASAATTAQLFTSRDVYVACSSAHLGIRILAGGANMSVSHPVVHGSKVAMARGYISIVKGSEHKAAGEYYIDQMVSTNMQIRLYKEVATIPVNVDALEAVKGEVATDREGKPFLIMDPETVAGAWAPKFDLIDKRQWARRWQRAVAVQG